MFFPITQESWRIQIKYRTFIKETIDIGKIVVKRRAKKRQYEIRNEEIENQSDQWNLINLFENEERFQDKRLKMDCD